MTNILDKPVAVIVNPLSGYDQPVLRQLKKFFNERLTSENLFLCFDFEEVKTAVDQAQKESSWMLVYGGDGTVVEVAKQLAGSSMPLAIIPGGTANIFAKELDLPTALTTSLQRFSEQKFHLQRIDIGAVNSQSFLLRVNFGLFARMISTASNDQKEFFGNLAYAIKAVENWQELPEMTFHIETDSKKKTIKAVGLMVTNVGNTGLSHSSLHPKISAEDGKLDLIAITKEMGSLIDIASSSLFQQPLEQGLTHIQSEKIILTVDDYPEAFIDDHHQQLNKQSKFEFISKPNALTVIVPDLK